MGLHLKLYGLGFGVVELDGIELQCVKARCWAFVVLCSV